MTARFNRLVDRIFWWSYARWRVRQDADSLRSFESWVAFDLRNAEYSEKHRYDV